MNQKIEFSNSKIKFGRELKKLVTEKCNVVDIGIWAYRVYMNWEDVNDSTFSSLLLYLSRMELGPEFACSYEELNQIADDFISGKNVER